MVIAADWRGGPSSPGWPGFGTHFRASQNSSACVPQHAQWDGDRPRRRFRPRTSYGASGYPRRPPHLGSGLVQLSSGLRSRSGCTRDCFSLLPPRVAGDRLASYKAAFGFYAALALGVRFSTSSSRPDRGPAGRGASLGTWPSTAAETGPRQAGTGLGRSACESIGISPQSKKLVARLAALSGLDSLGGGFLADSLLAYWFFRRFGVTEASLGPLFFAGHFLNGVSYPVAAWLARRIGLV